LGKLRSVAPDIGHFMHDDQKMRGSCNRWHLTLDHSSPILHSPKVECIGRGKVRSPYEFGCKVSIATLVTAPKGGQFVLHAKALQGNPYDGHTLAPVSADLEKLTGVEVRRIHVDKGYRAHNHLQLRAAPALAGGAFACPIGRSPAPHRHARPAARVAGLRHINGNEAAHAIDWIDDGEPQFERAGWIDSHGDFKC
jgi:hypothetical protein